MKARLRTTAGILGVVFVATLVALGTFVGCRARYGGTSDGGSTGDDFLATGRTLSFFRAIQVDPQSEDSAGPQFVVAEDLDSDGLLDLVSAWNQSQPVQIHLQRRTASGSIRFETTTLAGNIPVVAVAGLAVADFDQDGAPDIAVLIKESLISGAGCLDSEQPESPEDVLNGVLLIYFGPADVTQVNQALAWRDQEVNSSFLAGAGDSHSPPEVGGYTSMTVGDMDGDDDLDIVVAWNSACGSPEVLLFTNQGSAAVQDGTWPVEAIPDPFQCSLSVDVEQCRPIKSVVLGDIDRDSDLDIVVTFPEARSMNLRWYRNPAVNLEDDCHIDNGSWQVGTVGQIEPRAGLSPIGGADIVRVSDIDGDGILDVVVRSTGGKILQWLKGPECPTTPTTPALSDPFRNVPWRVYTIAEFTERTPEGLTVGDLNFDGTPEVITSAAGGLLFLDSQTAPSVYDQWIESLIIDDEPPGRPDSAPATTDPNVAPEEVAGTTFINSILVVDLDGDGANDLVATFDRTGLSGLSNDALVWFHNTRRPPG
jgi:hypothetical protein